jgi:hypothetical protein
MTSILLVLAAGVTAGASPYAVEVIDSSGLAEGYDASAVVGPPTRSLYDPWSQADIDISMVYGPWAADDIASFQPGGHVTIRFDSPVTDDPLHPYGADFIIFGNAAFVGASGWVEADTDMTAYMINETGAAFGVDAMTVSVSRDGTTWHAFASPPAGGYWPTQAYGAWEASAGAWDHGSPSNFMLPMNPDLTPADFAGLSVVEALALYEDSGGGTAFDIGALGLDEITYVRVDGPGVIDGFARVVPEPAAALILMMGGAAAAVRRRLGK